MKAICHRCFKEYPEAGLGECCDWGNCKKHCIEFHTGFIRHYDRSWLPDIPFSNAPTMGEVVEEIETTYDVSEWAKGGSISLEEL